MSKLIKHVGVIESIEGSHVRVKIVQTSACAGCKVASRCNASESKEKLIDIYTNPNGLNIGQSVTVTASEAVAKRAVLIGFVFPLILIVGILIAMKGAEQSDEVSALCAIASLLPYYLLIWFLRERIASSISFQLEKTFKH